MENQFIHRILDSRLQLEFDFAVVISITVNTADSRKVMQRPTVSQHASGGFRFSPVAITALRLDCPGFLSLLNRGLSVSLVGVWSPCPGLKLVPRPLSFIRMMDMIQALAARDRGNGGPCRISPFRGMVHIPKIQDLEPISFNYQLRYQT